MSLLGGVAASFNHEQKHDRNPTDVNHILLGISTCALPESGAGAYRPRMQALSGNFYQIEPLLIATVLKAWWIRLMQISRDMGAAARSAGRLANGGRGTSLRVPGNLCDALKTALHWF
jgi:hypothetical protein